VSCRGSKLTEYLQDSLLNSGSNTLILLTCGLSHKTLTETKRTLNFGSEVCKIRNQVDVDEVLQGLEL
jgi:hypothetical protein